MMRKWSILLLSFWLLVPSVWGATYYVTPSGNDTNPGTKAKPWRSPSYAASHVSAGDTVIFNGVFDHNDANGDILLPIPSHGTDYNPIIFDGNNATLRGDNITKYCIRIYPYAHDLIIKNFNVGSCLYFGIYLEGNNTTIQNCDIHNNGNNASADHAYGVGGIYASNTIKNITIKDNTIYNNGRIYLSNNAYDHGIYFQASQSTISHNTIYDNQSFGLQLTGNNCKIFNNTITGEYNRGGMVLWKASCHDNVIANNIIYNNSTRYPSSNRCAIDFNGDAGNHTIVNNIGKANGLYDLWCSGDNVTAKTKMEGGNITKDPLLDAAFIPGVHSPAKKPLIYLDIGEEPYIGSKKPSMDKETNNSLLEVK